MKLKILALTVTFLSLVNCDDSTLSRPNGISSGQLPGEAIVGTGAQGTGSGGGGYDQEAKLGVQLAQKFLSKAIRNSDKIVFEQFPVGFKKAELIKIVENLKFYDDYIERDGESLLLNYDFDEK